MPGLTASSPTSPNACVWAAPHPPPPRAEQRADQMGLAAAGRPHDVEVVAGMAHADAEMRRVDRAHLADAFGEVVELGGGREREMPGIAGGIQAARGKRRKLVHVFF